MSAVLVTFPAAPQVSSEAIEKVIGSVTDSVAEMLFWRGGGDLGTLVCPDCYISIVHCHSLIFGHHSRYDVECAVISTGEGAAEEGRCGD